MKSDLEAERIKSELASRQSGEWGAWDRLDYPEHPYFKVAHCNQAFCVLEHMMSDGTRHLLITSQCETRPSWPEAQRIKDELAGENATAVEVYPPHAEIVDRANVYHLWVLTKPLPFGLKKWQSHPEATRDEI